jgi:hypothetical protein
MLICNLVGLDILVDPYSLATTAELGFRASLLADIQFRYPLAFTVTRREIGDPEKNVPL